MACYFLCLFFFYGLFLFFLLSFYNMCGSAHFIDSLTRFYLFAYSSIAAFLVLIFLISS